MSLNTGSSINTLSLLSSSSSSVPTSSSSSSSSCSSFSSSSTSSSSSTTCSFSSSSSSFCLPSSSSTSSFSIVDFPRSSSYQPGAPTLQLHEQYQSHLSPSPLQSQSPSPPQSESHSTSHHHLYPLLDYKNNISNNILDDHVYPVNDALEGFDNSTIGIPFSNPSHGNGSNINTNNPSSNLHNSSIVSGEGWQKLLNLKNLLSAGFITRTEYKERKSQLIDEMTGTTLNSNNSINIQYQHQHQFNQTSHENMKNIKINSNILLHSENENGTNTDTVNSGIPIDHITLPNNSISKAISSSMRKTKHQTQSFLYTNYSLTSSSISSTLSSTSSSSSTTSSFSSSSSSAASSSSASSSSSSFCPPPIDDCLPSFNHPLPKTYLPFSSIINTDLEFDSVNKSFFKLNSIAPVESLNVSVSDINQMKEMFRIVPRPPPDFSLIPCERATKYIFDLNSFTWYNHTCFIKLDPIPFGRGTLRLVYHLKDLEEEEKERKKKKEKKRNQSKSEEESDDYDDGENDCDNDMDQVSMTHSNDMVVEGEIRDDLIDDHEESENSTSSDRPQEEDCGSIERRDEVNISNISQINTVEDDDDEEIDEDLVDRISPISYVAKLSLDPRDAANRDIYFRDVEMQTIAKYYASLFNSYSPPKLVDFVSASLLRLDDREGQPLCGVERYIEGNYRKWNNNYGFVNEDERNTPQSFSHFTYEASGHKLLICDIQGVSDLYTDPQIHTTTENISQQLNQQPKYSLSNNDNNSIDNVENNVISIVSSVSDLLLCGKGNLGQRGIDRFLQTHRCNAICRYLKLPSINADYSDLGTLPMTEYMAYEQVKQVNIINNNTNNKHNNTNMSKFEEFNPINNTNYQKPSATQIRTVVKTNFSTPISSDSQHQLSNNNISHLTSSASLASSSSLSSIQASTKAKTKRKSKTSVEGLLNCNSNTNSTTLINQKPQSNLTPLNQAHQQQQHYYQSLYQYDHSNDHLGANNIDETDNLGSNKMFPSAFSSASDAHTDDTEDQKCQRFCTIL